SNKTVAKLFEEAGDASIAYIAKLRDLAIRNVQADEIHSFVGVKEAHLSEATSPVVGAGTVWAFLAVCTDSKLIFDYRVGDRGLPDATAFAKSMVGKLRRTERGEFVVRPLIVTDGHRPYYEAFETVVGSDADRAVLIKRYSKLDANGEPLPSSRYVGSDRKIIVGSPAMSDIHTSYIERQNLNLRMGNRRYNRRTNAFSKTMLNHERHLALWIMYHNLCWMPRPHRQRVNEGGVRSSRWEKRLPAAVSAGIEEGQWSVDRLLALTDAFTAQRVEATVVEAVTVTASPATASHWVYRNELKRSANVHTAECSNCRHGEGKRGIRSVGEWFPFSSLEEAVEGACQIEPDRHTQCTMCLGTSRSMGRRL
ncbi:MAG: hypothetical protein ACRYHC_08655, partial [Janthinobacterium lividum]